MTSIKIDKSKLLEILNLYHKVYKPIKSFNSLTDFENIVNNMHLSNKFFFPLPILFDIPTSVFIKLKNQNKLKCTYRNQHVATLSRDSLFTIDKKKFIKKIFDTNDRNHPGVKNFLNLKKYFISGRVLEINKTMCKKFINDYVTPSDTKLLFKKLKWKTISAFHTRNIPHLGHEWIHKYCKKNTDGVLIQPLCGKLKKGDYTSKLLIDNNKNYIEQFYEKIKFEVLPLFTFARYAGPREALFHCLIRKNYGCTHIYIGRDHAGVGSYYKKYASQNLCIKKENILGIKILFSKEPVFCNKSKIFHSIRSCCYKKGFIKISGTEIRNFLISNKKIDKKLFRHNFFNKLKSNKSLFVK